MHTHDIKEKFTDANIAANAAAYGDYVSVAVAIYQGLKLIALAIIYHANNK